MKGRGLVVADEEFALDRLRELNYYRLHGYWLTLERNDVIRRGSEL